MIQYMQPPPGFMHPPASGPQAVHHYAPTQLPPSWGSPVPGPPHNMLTDMHTGSQQNYSHHNGMPPSHPAATPSHPYPDNHAPAAAAGNYTPSIPNALPRMGRGLYKSNSSLVVGAGGAGITVAAPAQGGPPEVMTPGRRRGDSLEHFMAAHNQGGVAPAAGRPSGPTGPMDGIPHRPHAGKSAKGTFSFVYDAAQPPPSPALGGNVPHLKRVEGGGRADHLQHDAAGGLIPSQAAMEPPGGRRNHWGAPAVMTHIQMSPTGLTAEGYQHVGRSVHKQANASSIAMSHGGLSHVSADGGYPVIAQPRYSGVSAMQNNLVQRDAGLMQGGADPVPYKPHAGKNQHSQLAFGGGGMGNLGDSKAWVNPHAGKGQVSSLTYSNGTLTCTPPVGSELRRPAPGNGHWSTTYDSEYDQYSRAAVNNSQFAEMQRMQRPDRF